jgi:uncharacterized membrane protein
MANVDPVRVLGRIYRPGTEIQDESPPTWRRNPSSWAHRLPIIAAALLGGAIAISLTLYQLGVIPGIWEPFFGNGSQSVLTGRVSRLLPIPDAMLGGLGYMGDALAGLIGGTARWRKMPWIVIIFAIFVIPFGLTSTILFIIQPTLYNTWCTLCLTSVAISLTMVPYAWTEFVASWQWMRGRLDAGAGLWSALMGH